MSKYKLKKAEYYEQRRIDMLYLKQELLWTNAEVGKKWNVTGDRVRQITGNLGGTQGRRSKRAVEKLQDLSPNEIADMTGLSVSYVRHLHPEERLPVVGNSGLAIGCKWEEYCVQDLNERGLSAELMRHGYPFDVLVNGEIRIDVKSCETEKSPPTLYEHSSPVWRFNVGVSKKRGNCDFYYCITRNEDVFIIPSSIIPSRMQQVVFCYPTKYPNRSKWQKYIDRYDLIKGQR